MRFDLVILGDTPDAWAAAEDAALLGWKTAVLRPGHRGDAIETGIAAVLSLYGDEAKSAPARQRVRPCDLWNESILQHEREITRLKRELGVVADRGDVRFVGPNALEIRNEGFVAPMTGRLMLIAVGTTSRRPRGMTLDRDRLILPEDVPQISTVPRSLVVLGGDRTARAFARFFAAIGTDVRLIDGTRGDGSSSICSMFDRTIGDVLELRREPASAAVHMTDGRIFVADAVLFAANRAGATSTLDLASAGLEADEDGRLWCDDDGRTWVPHIRAVGDVVGYPRALREDAGAARRIAFAHAGRLADPLSVL